MSIDSATLIALVAPWLALALNLAMRVHMLLYPV